MNFAQYSRTCWRFMVGSIAICCAITVGRLSAADNPAGGIDWNRAKALHEKQISGQPLTDDEKAYLDRAKEAYRSGARPGGQSARPGQEGRGGLPAPPPAKDHTGL